MQPAPASEYSRKWYVMAAVSMGVFLATLDGSIVNIAMPTLRDYFGTNLAVVQWVALAYLLTITTLLLSIGRLADIIGKKSIYMVGFVIFTAGSVLCAFAPTVGWLIGFRVFQALGAAMITALGPAIITEAFPASERGRALGLIGLAVSVGIITGPTLGGLLIQVFSWHWIFLVNLPFGIVGTWMVWQYVPAIQPRGGQRFDYVGAATMFVSLLCLLLALTLGQRNGFADPAVLLLFAGWLLFLGFFLATEIRVSQPMVELRLFRNSDFSVGLLTGFISFVLIQGVLFLMPFYLEDVLGYDSLMAGQLLAILPITLGIASPLSGWLSDRHGSRAITVAGLALLLLGYLSISGLSTETSAWGFVLALLPLGLGMGVFQSPNNSAIMGAVPPQQLGVASGFLSITRTLGQTAGIATLAALWAGRVAFYAPDSFATDTTDAPAWAQVAGLHDVSVVAVMLISVALLLAGGAWVRDMWQRRRHAEA